MGKIRKSIRLSIFHLAFMSFLILPPVSGSTSELPIFIYDGSRVFVPDYHEKGRTLYEFQTTEVAREAIDYIRRRTANKKENEKLAIVFDTDETLLSNYEYIIREHNNSLNETALFVHLAKGIDPPISGVCNLFSYARKKGVTPFIITGRHEVEGVTREDLKQATVKNLKRAGCNVEIDFDKLFLKEDDVKYKIAKLTKTLAQQAVELGCGAYAVDYYRKNAEPSSTVNFKAQTRQEIEALGYTIIANIGDQCSDLLGGHTETAYKLPNYMYFLP